MRLLRCGALGAMLFIAVFLVDGATRSGYSPARLPVSALSLGPRGWIQIANFVGTGILMVVFAWGLRLALHPGRGATWGPLLLAVFGAGLVLSGMFVMDPMRGYPPGTPAGVPARLSWHHNLHDIAGLVVFVALPAAALVLARRFRSAPVRRRWADYSAATAIAMVALFVAFSVAWEIDSAVAGLFQRALIVVGWVWIALLATFLARTLPPEEASTGPGRWR